MATRLVSVVFDANDHRAQAQWWADALDAPVAGEDADEDADEAWLTPDNGPEILFDAVTEPKRTTNRVHLDLATYSKAEHTALVNTLIDRGATRIDLGQGDVDWVVLTNPEGNEFCVIEPRPLHRSSGRLATIMLETVKNRVYLDVAPMPEADQHLEVERLVAAGSRRVDIGQGDVPWVVLADLGGNEFCVLTLVDAPRSGDVAPGCAIAQARRTPL